MPMQRGGLACFIIFGIVRGRVHRID
jgi:hypothetical protein